MGIGDRTLPMNKQLRSRPIRTLSLSFSLSRPYPSAIGPCACHRQWASKSWMLVSPREGGGGEGGPAKIYRPIPIDFLPSAVHCPPPLHRLRQTNREINSFIHVVCRRRRRRRVEFQSRGILPLLLHFSAAMRNIITNHFRSRPATGRPPCRTRSLHSRSCKEPLTV